MLNSRKKGQIREDGLTDEKHLLEVGLEDEWHVEGGLAEDGPQAGLDPDDVRDEDPEYVAAAHVRREQRRLGQDGPRVASEFTLQEHGAASPVGRHGSHHGQGPTGTGARGQHQRLVCLGEGLLSTLSVAEHRHFAELNNFDLKSLDIS